MIDKDQMMIDARYKKSERIRMAVDKFTGKQEFTTSQIAGMIDDYSLPNVRHHLTQMWGRGELVKKIVGKNVFWRRKEVRRKAQ